MNKKEFMNSLNQVGPPAVSQHLAALWYDARGDWDRSHKIIQDLDDTGAAWIHAYLHRKEGDEGNAGYWYQRAGRDFPKLSLDDEWKELLEAMI